MQRLRACDQSDVYSFATSVITNRRMHLVDSAEAVTSYSVAIKQEASTFCSLHFVSVEIFLRISMGFRKLFAVSLELR